VTRPVDHANNEHCEHHSDPRPGIGSQAIEVAIFGFVSRWQAGWHADVLAMTVAVDARLMKKTAAKKAVLFALFAFANAQYGR
jgi:hypothetical protein